MIKKPDVLSDEEIQEIIARCDYEDSKASYPLPITPLRYEGAVAEAQLDVCVKHYEPLIKEMYEALKEALHKAKDEKQAVGRIEHWVDNFRSNKTFNKKDKYMMVTAIRDYLIHYEVEVLGGLKQALLKTEGK